MLSINENIEKTAHRQVRDRVRTAVQPGVLHHIIKQEISNRISEALNDQLAAEASLALGRSPYERIEGSIKRNGFKPFSLPGLGGPP